MATNPNYSATDCGTAKELAAAYPTTSFLCNFGRPDPTDALSAGANYDGLTLTGRAPVAVMDGASTQKPVDA